MSSEYVVFCTDEGDDSYGWFWHEADVLLTALGRDVAEGKMTADEARRAWDTYRGSWPALYEAEEWAEDEFPINEELEYLPGSARFWHVAAKLDIPGVGFSDDTSPASGEIFEVWGAESLEALRTELKDRYRIAVKDDLNEYASLDSEEAKALIEQAKE